MADEDKDTNEDDKGDDQEDEDDEKRSIRIMTLC